MRVNVIGGGPGGLYAAILLKKQNPDAVVRVYERNAKDSTFGFGIVLSVETLGRLQEADPESCDAIRAKFTFWDDLHIWFKGRSVSSKGHGFSGLERLTLLTILQDRAQELGVECIWSHDAVDFDQLRDADLVIGSDGVYSTTREHFREQFKPSVVMRPNRFVWLGSSIPLPGFTFIFKENEHGIWVVHSYQYKDGCSTFVVETTPDTFERAGLDDADESATVAYIRRLFKEELEGHELITNKSVWRQFPVINCERWHHENVVLLGDAVHTAHYSIGSGTKLAMEDAIALAACLKDNWHNVPQALKAYETERRPAAQKIQRAAEVSLRWFEALGRYWSLSPVAFNFSLLTRSKQITYENLLRRDPEFIRELNRSISGDLYGDECPPIRTPFALGNIELPTRLVDVQSTGADTAGSEWAFVLLAPVSLGDAVREASSPLKANEGRHHGRSLALAENASIGDLDVAVRHISGGDAALLELDVAAMQGQSLETISALIRDARSVWPTERLLGVRITCTADEDACFAVAQAAKEAGAALIHVRGTEAESGGRDNSAPVNLAERIKLELNCAVLLSNATESDDERNTVIGASRADLVASNVSSTRKP